jgi:N-acetylglucosamine-6-phosphate deacetylase
MSELLLKNAQIATVQSIDTGSVLIRDGRIAQVTRYHPTGLSSEDSVDLNGAYLAPGMIDIHIHGSVGVDVLEADREGLSKLSRFLLQEGVTGYFATLVPTSDAGYKSSLAEIENFIAHQRSETNSKGHLEGARVLGVHFEGPFVSRHRCGALQPRYLRSFDGDARSIELFIPSVGGHKLGNSSLITVAPEIEGGVDLIKKLLAGNDRIFIGHTEADPELLDVAAQAGARHITHFPNALDPLHHRNPGAVAWGLLRDDISFDCIADFHHVHPLMLELMYKAKGPGRMALISDAILPTGQGDGEFEVWGDRIGVTNGRTSLLDGTAKGTIAGSVITMRQAIKNIVSIGVSLEEAFRMASAVPASAAGIDSELGSIQVGKIADLVAFDNDFNVLHTVVHGKLVSN